MAKKELIWKRNTNDNSQMVQTTLSKLSSNDPEHLHLEVIPTVEHTVEHTVDTTIEPIVEYASSSIVEHPAKQTVDIAKASAVNPSIKAINSPTHIESETVSIETTALEENHLEVKNEKEIISDNRLLIANLEKEQEYFNILSKVDKSLLSELEGTHTETEHKLYLVMYCESRKHNSKDRYFSGIELARLLGLKHRRNIMNVLQKLEMKKCISIITSSPGQVLGKEYRIYEPGEIIERRKKSKMRIHPQTKKIV